MKKYPTTARAIRCSVVAEFGVRPLVIAVCAALVSTNPTWSEEWREVEPTPVTDFAAEDAGVTVEDSVLVDARAATEEDAASTEAASAMELLEPISKDSDLEPEPAAELLPIDPELSSLDDEIGGDEDSADSDASDFGAALSRVARQNRSVFDGAEADPATELDVQLAASKVAKFNGIQPGASTLEDVTERWGDPLDVLQIPGGEVLVYEIKPFRQIEVVLVSESVDTIKIELEKVMTSDALIRQLRLSDVEPAEIRDASGKLLGQIFPERGVLFMVADTEDDLVRSVVPSEDVSHLVIQTLDPIAFTLRAETRPDGQYEESIRDLGHALALDPESAHTHWLLADIYLATGQANQAETHASKAFRLDPGNDAYRLRWAQSLEMLARYDDAVRETRAVLDGEELPPLVKARGLHQMGRLATLGGAEIRAKTIPFHTSAIEVADLLSTSEDVRQRRAAKELLVDAHLAIAREVAAQDFNNKLDALSQWIGRASGLAEDAITNDDGSLELRLRVAESALAALADLKPTRDPAGWIREAQEATDDLLGQSDDTLWRRRIQWQLGMAYFHALRIEHTRRSTASALSCGQKAIENLAEGAKCRQAVPDSEHLVGRLYFHVGAIHAVHNNDHDEAVNWYDKAYPLLTAQVPITELAVPRRHGEALVSMGVTYWQQNRRAAALEVTQMGADLVEQAVAGGVLKKEALAVPYGNLATMHKELGNESQAARFADLARNARPVLSPNRNPSAVSYFASANQGSDARGNSRSSVPARNLHPEQRSSTAARSQNQLSQTAASLHQRAVGNRNGSPATSGSLSSRSSANAASRPSGNLPEQSVRTANSNEGSGGKPNRAGLHRSQPRSAPRYR